MTGEPMHSASKGSNGAAYSESKVSIMHLCQVFLTCCTQYDMCSESYASLSATFNLLHSRTTHTQNTYFSAMFNPLHSSTNQEFLKSIFIFKVATMKNTDGAMCPSYINYHWSEDPSCFFANYVQPVTQKYKSKTIQKGHL